MPRSPGCSGWSRTTRSPCSCPTAWASASWSASCWPPASSAPPDPPPRSSMDLQRLGTELADEAAGRSQRQDGVLPRTGGPAGNARLTAWTGVILFVLFIAELVTLLDVRGLISWHVALGVLLVPPALLKTASTGWRFLRYYTRGRPYVQAGPPILPLRVLGPFVIVTTLGLLGSGLTLIALGEQRSREDGVAGFSWANIHQGFFILTGI